MTVNEPIKDKNWKVSLQELDEPYAWIQWKGTNVCCDIHCPNCDTHYHFDGYFLYFWECPKCRNIYELDARVRMVKVPSDKITEVKAECCVIIGEGEQ